MNSNVSHRDLCDLTHDSHNSQPHIEIVAARETDDEESSLDEILERIGQLGTYQIYIILLACVAMTFNSIAALSYIFTASSVVHRCRITECDTSWSAYQEPWTQFTIPTKSNELDQCNRYVANYTSNPTITTSPLDEEQGLCHPHNFDSNKRERCADNNFIFRDEEVTISNEFGIYCENEWQLALVGTIANVGQFVGIPIGGFISDRYGRRNALALFGFLSSLLGLTRSFTPNYISFIIFEFLDNIASSPLFPICFILGIELVGPKRRVFAGTLISLFYPIGVILLAVAAKYFPNWRLVLRIFYIPAVLFILYIWLLPESARWLLSQGRDEDAKNILKRAALVNKRKLSDASLDKLILANHEKLAIATDGDFPIKEAFKKLYGRIANCSFCWIVILLVYFGISLNAVLLDGDKYNNFLLITLAELPGTILPCFIIDRFGRRYSLCSTMLLSGIGCLATALLPKEYFLLRLMFFLIAKLNITASLQVMYFLTSELLPTNLRSSLVSFCSMVGCVGGMLAPQTPLLAKLHENAPALLFAISAIISGILTLFLPETTLIELPTTMHDAQNIGAKQKEKNTKVIPCHSMHI